ncbi:NAD(P)/FAD-dependent oxidoreductase [Paenibacillus mendelii]|uniref:NAD(P)/FAD-dependent oxidoreductase n=1 Tax=Paenibacillus mendelii TaxID=206163 RepID=A0ABV6JAD8_9BACL|nr:FAD-dependent oxidoreductase [Paenibacillus mendelii]MCQ6559865.1 FAD-dependent oxidoreductase [Paenibacillus mendelii]
MKYNLTIIGAGIAGLTAAAKAYASGLERVLLIEHQPVIGGFTRGYIETSFFETEQRLLSECAALPYTIMTRSTVVGFFTGDGDTPHQLFVQTPTETEEIQTDYILIASGAMEKPREAWRISGGRPAGVMTPAMAVELSQRGYRLDEGKTMIYMADRRSHGAAEYLADRLGETIQVSAEDFDIEHIHGTAQLEGVTIRSVITGEAERVNCSRLLFAKGRYGSTFFLKGLPVERDESTLCIITDRFGATGIPRVYAAGSCTQLGDDGHTSSIEMASEVADHLLAKI